MSRSKPARAHAAAIGKPERDRREQDAGLGEPDRERVAIVEQGEDEEDADQGSGAGRPGEAPGPADERGGEHGHVEGERQAPRRAVGPIRNDAMSTAPRPRPPSSGEPVTMSQPPLRSSENDHGSSSTKAMARATSEARIEVSTDRDPPASRVPPASTTATATTSSGKDGANAPITASSRARAGDDPDQRARRHRRDGIGDVVVAPLGAVEDGEPAGDPQQQERPRQCAVDGESTPSTGGQRRPSPAEPRRRR